MSYPVRWNRILLLVLAGSLAGFPARLLAQPSAEEKIDIFIGGKKFNSIVDYKQYRVNAMQQEVLKEMEKEGKRAMPELELMAVPSSKHPLADDESSAGARPTNRDLPMGDVDFKALGFDPSKVKTISIVPKYYYSPGAGFERSFSDLLGDYLEKILEDIREKKSNWPESSDNFRESRNSPVAESALIGMGEEDIDRLVEELGNRREGRLNLTFSELEIEPSGEREKSASTASAPSPASRFSSYPTLTPFFYASLVSASPAASDGAAARLPQHLSPAEAGSDSAAQQDPFLVLDKELQKKLAEYNRGSDKRKRKNLLNRRRSLDGQVAGDASSAMPAGEAEDLAPIIIDRTLSEYSGFSPAILKNLPYLTRRYSLSEQ